MGERTDEDKVRAIASDLRVAAALCEAASHHADKGELERVESLSRKALEAIERARSMP